MDRDVSAANYPPNSGKRRRNAFTVWEVLTVITVIAILGAILFPVFAKATEASRKANCASNLLQLGTALQVYAHDWDGKLPPHHNDLTPLSGGYLTTAEILRCPTDPLFPPSKKRSHADPVVDAWRYPSYQYRGGLSVDDRADIPLAADWDFHHGGGAYVLLLSGSAKFQTWRIYAPVAPGPRPLPPGVVLPAGVAPTPFVEMRNGRAVLTDTNPIADPASGTSGGE